MFCFQKQSTVPFRKKGRMGYPHRKSPRRGRLARCRILCPYQTAQSTKKRSRILKALGRGPGVIAEKTRFVGCGALPKKGFRSSGRKAFAKNNKLSKSDAPIPSSDRRTVQDGNPPRVHLLKRRLSCTQLKPRKRGKGETSTFEKAA